MKHYEEAEGLVAVILAIKSSRGESIVYHYPPSTCLQRYAGPEENSTELDDEDDPDERAAPLPRRTSTDVPHNAQAQPQATSNNDQEHHRDPPWHKILGLESVLLADIFTPQLSDPKFEMWIDNLTFVGSPVRVRDDGQWLKRKARQHQEDEPLTPIAELENKLDNATIVDRPRMSTFHLVFALNVKIDPVYHRKVQELYEHVVSQLTFALTYEQARDDYVWKQSEMILDLKKQGLQAQSSLQTVWNRIEGQSDLARNIRHVFEKVKENAIAHLCINKQLNLSLAIPQDTSVSRLLPDRTNHPFLTSALSFGNSLEEADPLVMPHYALLLLDDPETIVAALPPGSSSVVAKFVRTIRPTLTFFNLAESMGISLQDVSTLARHLIHWHCAHPIPPLHPRNIYITSPSANLTKLNALAPVFAARFPTVPPLPKLLALMSRKMVPFNAFIPSKDHRTLYLGVLTWLMRYKWLIEVRLFVWVKVRAEIKLKVMEAADGVAEKRNLEVEDSLIADPYSAGVEERRWLNAIAHQHGEEASLFERLSKYFNGQHAMEKIAVREGVHRKTLRRLLEVYEDDLIKCYTW